MNNYILALVLSLVLGGHYASLAQKINLPAKSPEAKVGQTIGYTHIEMEYSAPSVKERVIWGELVPYDEIWRAGANKATTITFDKDVEIERQPLKAGTYSFFVLPQPSGKWTVIFNTNTELWGAYEYKQEEDALRVEVSPRFSDRNSEERLKYEIVSQDIENGYILLSWEKLRLYIRLKVNTMDKAVAEIKEAISNASADNRWKLEGQAADFLLWVGQPGPAFAYAERALKLKETVWGYWIKANIHAELGDYRQALDAAQKAKAMGRETDDAYYTRNKKEIARKIVQWEEALDK
jgi:tetratricopeptide (TPR) repeat protein